MPFWDILTYTILSADVNTGITLTPTGSAQETMYPFPIRSGWHNYNIKFLFVKRWKENSPLRRPLWLSDIALIMPNRLYLIFLSDLKQKMKLIKLLIISIYMYTKRGLQIRMHIWKLFFLFLYQNICCGYSKDPSQWDFASQHPKTRFNWWVRE